MGFNSVLKGLIYIYFPIKIRTCLDILRIILREFTPNKHMSYTDELSNRLKFLVLKNCRYKYCDICMCRIDPYCMDRNFNLFDNSSLFYVFMFYVNYLRMNCRRSKHVRVLHMYENLYVDTCAQVDLMY
jgi:hypothetical protein